MRYLILAQSDVTARALVAWLELLGEPRLQGDTERMDDARVLTKGDPGLLSGGFVEGFRRVAARLEEESLAAPYGRLTVLVDSVRVSDLNAVGSAGGWDRLIALLILAFPDVCFVFGVSTGFGESKPKPDEWNARHGLASLFGPQPSPLFDGLGLRAHVRSITAKHPDREGAPVAPWIPQRKQWAVAIDDEPMYAYLHAYVAYRHGYRAFAVHSMALGDRLLKTEDADKSGWALESPDLTLEDYYLGFPDKEAKPHLAHLPTRTEHWTRLENKTIRHFITSGHGRSQGENNVRENREFRRELRLGGRGGREATKPLAGMFALWQELGLDRQLQYTPQGRPLRGQADGFIWPHDDRHDVGEASGGHSAPGLLLLVAETLIARAEARIDSVKNVKDAVRGAVFATTAQELLGPKTPTTAREALELKHRFEVLAECQFGGIQYNLQPEQRFAEIRRDMKLLGRWYGVGGRDAAVLNGELTIISRLMRVFREFEEFDEEEKCRARMRSLQRAIWWRKGRANPFVWLVWPVRTYIEFLIGSMTRFAGALILWIVALTVAFSYLESPAREQAREQTSEVGVDVLPGARELFGTITLPQAIDNERWQGELRGIAAPEEPDYDPLSSAISFFFGVEPLESPLKGWVFVSILAILSGFIHLGIFVSQLYSIVARK